MGAPRGHRVLGARRLLWGAAAVVLVLPLAAMGRSSVRSSMAADRAETEIAFACGETALSVFVVGSVTPPSTAPGGRVGLTVDLRIPATASIPPEAQVAVTWLLPAAIPTVRHLAVTARDGVSATSSSTAPGAFTVVLTAAEAETPGELGATVTARLVTSATAAAGLVSVPGPSGFTLLSAAGSTIGPTVCVAVSPPAPLAGFTVTLPDEPEEPEEPVPPENPVPPDTPPADDPGGGGDAPSPPPLPPDEVPVVPPAEDPSTASRVLTDAAAAGRRLDRAQERLGAAADRVEALDRQVAAMEATEAGLEALRHGLAPVLEAMGDELEQQALDAYLAAAHEALTGQPSVRPVGDAAVQASTAAYARRAEQALGVIDELADLAPVRAHRQDALDRVEARRQRLAGVVADARQEVRAFRADGGVVIGGFHFPVAGPNSFVDTWLAPRSGGRQHQGTDIFADEGVPVAAAERGVLAGVGTDPLGGTKLWLVGESGTHYYYAHLSAYAEGVADGVLVEAGEVIGYVGHTGNARTTPPHLHFEVHPRGDDAVNGYALLLAAAGGGAEAPDPGPTRPTPAPDPGPSTTTVPTTVPAPGTSPEPDAEHAFVRSWGTPGPGAGQLDGPTGLAVAVDALVYVVDTGNDRIEVVTATGEPVATWSVPGFVEPTGVAVAPDGTVYVADAGADRILVLGPDGERREAWGRSGVGPGAFDGPSAVAVGPDGRVYVADTFNNRIQVFAPTGRFLRAWGTFGTAPGQFANPYGVAVDPVRGAVVVADTFNNRIQVFTPTGEVIAVWGEEGPADGQFDLPVALAVGPRGEVTVTDQANGRIQQFLRDGTFLGAWGTPGSGDGQFAEPGGVAVDPAGRVLVADTGNARIQVFRPVLTVSP